MDKNQSNRRWMINFVVDIGDDDGHALVVGEFDGGNRSHVRGRVGLRSLWKPQIAAASLRVTSRKSDGLATSQQPLVWPLVCFIVTSHKSAGQATSLPVWPLLVNSH